MKKVSPFMLTVGIGSALAWLMLRSDNKKAIKNILRQVKPAKTRDNDGINYI